MAGRPSEAQTQAEEEPTVSTPKNFPEGTPPQKESKKTKPVVVESTPAGPQIKKIRLSDGSFHFLDHEKRNIALFDGVQFSSSMRDVDSIRGHVRIDKIVLRDRVFLSELRSPIRYDPSELELSGITAEIAKGQLIGDFSMEPQAEDSPFTVHASFRRVQADELVAEAGGSRDMIRGILEGTFDATGKTANLDALTGSGTILLHSRQTENRLDGARRRSRSQGSRWCHRCTPRSREKQKKEKCRVTHTVGPAQAVRVIAGTAGGLQLKVPRIGVRPTMDRVKAAIFSSLGEKVIGARVLDLFAGAGGRWLEAMCAGAAFAG